MKKSIAKKLIGMLLIGTMAVSAVGCGNGSAGDAAADTSGGTAQEQGQENASREGEYGVIDFDEEAYTLNVPIITLGETPQDIGLVEEKLNEYLLEKINCQVSLEAIGVSNLSNQYTLKASSGEKMDLINMLPTSVLMLSMRNSNMIMPLDNLVEEWGQGILESAGRLIEGGKIDGTLYLIPDFEGERVPGCGLEFNANLVNKYDLGDEILAIEKLEDLEPILQVIQENEPAVTPFAGVFATVGFTRAQGGYDELGDSLGVLDYSRDDLTVIDWYETDEYMRRCQLMHDWFKKGYISKDIITSQDSMVTLNQQGKVFCVIDTYAPNQNYGWDLENPNDGCVEIALGDAGVITTNGLSVDGWAIASSCERPDKAMQFINLLYTDPYVCQLLQYGIEDLHYTYDENGLVSLNVDGPYYIVFGQFGDESLLDIKDYMGVGYEERLAAYEKECSYSPAYGFRFDSAEYSTEVANCQAVVDEYYNIIDCGSVDPATAIPEFVDKLKAAGLETIMAAKQEQLDKWMETK